MIPVDPSQPIYQQIVDGMIRALVRGELRSGDQIPSQREMAEQLRISPNTVQRAYRDLELQGIVETHRGQGTFASVDAGRLEELRRGLARRAVQRFLDEMGALGHDREEALRLVSADPRT